MSRKSTTTTGDSTVVAEIENGISSLVKDNTFINVCNVSDAVDFTTIDMGYGDPVPCLVIGYGTDAPNPIYSAEAGMAAISAFVDLAVGKSYELVTTTEIRYSGYSAAVAAKFHRMNVGAKLVSTKEGKRWMSVDFNGLRPTCVSRIYGYRESKLIAISWLVSGLKLSIPMIVKDEATGRWRDITPWTTKLLSKLDKTPDQAQEEKIEAFRKSRITRYMDGQKKVAVKTLQAGEDIPLPASLVFDTKAGKSIDLMTLENTVWISVYDDPDAEDALFTRKFSAKNRVLVNDFATALAAVGKKDELHFYVAAANKSF